jgi:hypothetical protein
VVIDTLGAISTKSRILICGPPGGVNPWLERLRTRGYVADRVTISCPLSLDARMLLPTIDLLLLDLTTSSHETLNTIRDLVSAMGICTIRPRLLCFSSVHRNPQFVLNVERLGARYVFVADTRMLIEAIELFLAEMNAGERDGLNFVIVHQFSQGTCGPGEEVSSVMLNDRGTLFSLALGLAERLVFELLARHRRVLLDSEQIASYIDGHWFFRDHALNSGHRQVTKIRRASVKVRAHRIRQALASSFSQTHLEFDPHDVLRSCFAEGTNRVLYKLHGRVEWHHPPFERYR